jgi:monoamine oxidase
MSDAMGEFWESTDNQSGPPTQQGGISVFAGAGAAERALEQPDAAAWFTDRLDKLLPGYADQIAQHSFVAWPQVPYIKAGYSCPAPGQVTTAMKNLAEPYERRIVFAGEHVNPGFFRYMEGALQSGLLAMGHVVEATAALGDGSDAEPRFRHADVVRALREAAAAGRSFADGEAPAPAPTKKQRKSKSGKKRA